MTIFHNEKCMKELTADSGVPCTCPPGWPQRSDSGITDLDIMRQANYAALPSHYARGMTAEEARNERANWISGFIEGARWMRLRASIDPLTAEQVEEQWKKDAKP